MPSIVYFICGAIAGALIGFFWAGWRYRGGTAQKAALLSEYQNQLETRNKELQELQKTVSGLTKAAATAEASFQSGKEMLVQSRQFYETQLKDLKESHEKSITELREAFKALSSDALKQNQPEFLRLANETFSKFHESAKGDLSQRQQAIATLVEPLKQHLDTYQKRLAQSETSQAAYLGEVKRQVESLALQSQNLSTETLQLRRILSSNQTRGRWGEETLRRVIEAAGLSPHCDFYEQTQVGDGKPDLTVRLPGGRVIIIDSKVPDLDFLNGIESVDPLERAESLMAHANKLKMAIKALSERNYPSQFPQALDYVILFLPAESLFSAALEGDRDLIVWAASKQILLTTPASLIGLLRSVSVSWQQHSQTENAREITAAAQDLFSRILKFLDHFEKIRGGLDRTVTAYNDAVGSFEKMVRPAGEKLNRLGMSADQKERLEQRPVEQQLRLPPC